MLIKIVVITLLGTELVISVDEGEGVAEVCIELVSLPSNEFPIETNLLINVTTQESKTTIVSIAQPVSFIIGRFCNCWF